jgi:predicted Rossmann fold nucleotide-binding protein DprA/Smf involved in DNA uptake
MYNAKAALKNIRIVDSSFESDGKGDAFHNGAGIVGRATNGYTISGVYTNASFKGVKGAGIVAFSDAGDNNTFTNCWFDGTIDVDGMVAGDNYAVGGMVGMVPNGKHFPVRNRIISGLSLGTVVVEAGKGSGALITAEHARKQGRDVFAFPGDVDNQFCAGTNELISDGAKMVRCAADILVEYEGLWHKRIFTGNIKKNKYYTGEDLPPEAPVTVKEYSAEAAKKRTAPKASALAAIVNGEPRVTQEEFVRAKAEAERRDVFEEVFDFSKLNLAPETRDFTGITDYEKMVWEHINGAMTSDEIAQSIGKATGEPADLVAVLSALTTLEIEGYCESMPGGLFKRLD